MTPAPAPAVETVFVYGSLKRGFRNYHVMNRYATYMGDATLHGGLLFDLGAYPGLKLFASKEKTVTGELFSVPTMRIQSLDDFEGHPTYYKRTAVDVVDADGQTRIVHAYEYQLPVEAEQLIQSGTWAERG